MPFYDSFPSCSKCCGFINLRSGCILLVIFSILFRILIYIFQKTALAQSAFDEKSTVFEIIIVIFDVAIIGIAGTAADVLLILGATRKHHKYVQIYLPIMFFIFMFEFFLFIVWFILGYHWMYIFDYLLFSVFHVYCWFTAHSLSQNWNHENEMPTNREKELNQANNESYTRRKSDGTEFCENFLPK
uniref:CSON000014 protein n=1 Tax=Culicoides sonorensis TaxID=179676 RepID=A0A336LZ17_CULSO